LGPDADAAGGEDEQVHGIGQQGQADQHLEGAGPQHQPDAGCGQDADGEGEHDLHQNTSPPSPPVASLRRGRRSDWWAMAMRIRLVAPTTRMNTPRSNSTAVASGARPSGPKSR